MACVYGFHCMDTYISHTIVSQLTLVRLIAVVGEAGGINVANQTKLAKFTTSRVAHASSRTGRAAHSSWRWAPNVYMDDCEGFARLLRGTAGKAAGAVRNDEGQAGDGR